MTKAAIRREAEELLQRMETAISHLDCFALQSMTIDEVVNFLVEDDEGFHLDFFHETEEETKKLRITEAYFMLTNRRAARMEEIADFRIKCVSSYHEVQVYQ